ncbi:aldehyde dehydrogenase family protein [Gordonia sp. (in: high G+C Gram-positive bacteria)]|uniref:aldehyde dehydrogenase family protein n=2 Tax=Gordonia sp. (in: high G+C Gram-positive bacteria) TaxID=84139 RepID=UPI002605B021|nr:aldehyde dehydrogenase family protein [Gordonia sp. (in: high G+C Gram-positive bacteria)]HMS75701.1 aldehyde dehydrogenase family protein [Gordonia sp. (in: high G+C Gram-positive bacteria)]
MTTASIDIDAPHLDAVYLGGTWVKPLAGATVDVVMPSTGRIVATAADPGIDEADAAVAAARRAFDEGPWPRMSVDERIAVCTRFAEQLESRMDQLNRLWAIESGFPVSHGEMINTGAASVIWRAALDNAPKVPWREERISGGSEVVIKHDPIGVVLAILTYNGPVPEIGMKIIPGLLAGCVFIAKAAPDSQLTARVIAECAEAAGFPDGVVNIMAVGLDASRHLVSHPGVDMVHMTGGVSVGVDVVTQTAPRLARTVLELGGKSPAIILDDADLDEVLPTLVPAAIGGVGQICVALSRILIPRSRYEEIVGRLAAEFAAYKVGDPLDPTTVLGPLGNERALVRVESMLERALSDGAKVVAGGRRPPEFNGEGFYFEPTLLRDVDPDSYIAQEEVFGPIIVAIAYDDVEDAIAIANNSRFGLAASVYSADAATAFAVAERLQVGNVAVNLAGVCLTEPFGGIKQSGWGREGGIEGILEFTQIKQLLLSGASQANRER